MEKASTRCFPDTSERLGRRLSGQAPELSCRRLRFTTNFRSMSSRAGLLSDLLDLTSVPSDRGVQFLIVQGIKIQR
jgi:hypothetical protein